jgi:hypothetical protein
MIASYAQIMSMLCHDLLFRQRPAPFPLIHTLSTLCFLSSRLRIIFSQTLFGLFSVAELLSCAPNQ